MKKYLYLILILFILTGCTINYDIEISEENFSELIEIIETDPNNFDKVCEYKGIDSYKEKINFLYDQNTHTYTNAAINPYIDDKTDGVVYYEKEKISTYDSYGIQLKTNGEIVELSNLRSIKYCYSIAQVINNEDEYILSTSLKNTCFEKYPLLDEININITTDMKVNSNNADSVNGNTYTWKITRENYENKSISLEMQSIRDYNQDKYDEEQAQKREENRKKMEKQKGTVLTILAVIGSVFLVVVACLGILILIKNRRENKI